MLAPQLPSPASLIGPAPTAISLAAEMLIPPAGFRGGLLPEKLTPTAGLSGPAPTAFCPAAETLTPPAGGFLDQTGACILREDLAPAAVVACLQPGRVFRLVASGARLVASGALSPLEH
ncbi:hypothetical protein SKAU_G00278800 [Synaphobranchus kaupii]|uniref:Uncharacterized protein n=1 Tax=Synaphobranchus kaupii TaxID=118154 RepID=A0A9Q1IMT2_SYNKA|nr:hypothetical protein SKAU_G00278800 [Synaphobranchus kaupii]